MYPPNKPPQSLPPQVSQPVTQPEEMFAANNGQPAQPQPQEQTLKVEAQAPKEVKITAGDYEVTIKPYGQHDPGYLYRLDKLLGVQETLQNPQRNPREAIQAMREMVTLLEPNATIKPLTEAAEQAPLPSFKDLMMGPQGLSEAQFGEIAKSLSGGGSRQGPFSKASSTGA